MKSYPILRLLLWSAVPLLLVLLPTFSKAEILDLTPEELRDIASTGEALIFDVRVEPAWEAGHIQNASYFRNLASYLRVTPAEQINRTFQLLGYYSCLVDCSTVVYCRTSRAAREVLDLLHDKAGFIGANLYNGHGLVNWTAAGYTTVQGPSYRPPCMQPGAIRVNAEQVCPTTRNLHTNPLETTNPTSDPTLPPTPLPLPPTPSSSNPIPVPVQPNRKDAPETKCGSIANDGGRGGSAAAAKDCSRNGGRNRNRIRGI